MFVCTHRYIYMMIYRCILYVYTRIYLCTHTSIDRRGFGHLYKSVCCSVLQCVAVWRSALQSVAEYCRVFKSVAVCSSVWQCVAVCCSVVHCTCCLHIDRGWLGSLLPGICTCFLFSTHTATLLFEVYVCDYMWHTCIYVYTYTHIHTHIIYVYIICIYIHILYIHTYISIEANLVQFLREILTCLVYKTQTCIQIFIHTYIFI